METKLFCITSTLLKIPDLTEAEERNNGAVGKTDFYFVGLCLVASSFVGIVRKPIDEMTSLLPCIVRVISTQSALICI